MEPMRYLIVGGGMTGDAAVKGIRERDADGSIVSYAWTFGDGGSGERRLPEPI